MVISHTLLAAWDAIISPTEIESIRQILHALHKTIMRRIILMSKHKLLPIALTFVLATALCSTIFAQSDITSTIDAFNDYVAADNIAQVSGSFPNDPRALSASDDYTELTSLPLSEHVSFSNGSTPFAFVESENCTLGLGIPITPTNVQTIENYQVYWNIGQSVTCSVEANELGLREYCIIDSNNAPRQFTHELNLPTGYSLIPSAPIGQPEDGSYLIIDNGQTTIGGISAPHAYDALWKIPYLLMLMSKTTLLSLNWITLLLPILLHTEFNFIAIPNSRNTFIAADGNHMSLRGIIPWPLLHANGEQSFLTRQPKRFVGVQFTIVVSVRKHITGSMKPAFTTNFTVM